MKKKGYLIFETGETFEGVWHGGQPRAGEVVFNTSHSGYEEIATDPSYFSQIVVMTAPMQGNYGVDALVWESRRIWIEGFICLQVSNSKRENSWVQRLVENQVPCFSEADTRAITLQLRNGGTQWGALVPEDASQNLKEFAAQLIQKKKMNDKDWVWQASRKQVEKQVGNNSKGPCVAVLDFGAKENILRELRRLCREVVIFPSRATAAEIMAIQPQGLMLTNGPGDPGDVQDATASVRQLLGKLPIFGICMGHQILGLAAGAKTFKLKFGHRGSNHPIQDQLLGKIYTSSQNHGYAVAADSLPKDFKITHYNLNDKTVAGFYSENKNCLGIQYHPESHPGPHEASALFDYFVTRMIQQKSL